MNVEKLQDGQIKMKSGAWFDIFNEDKLETWIVFYEKLFLEYKQPKYKEWADTLRALN